MIHRRDPTWTRLSSMLVHFLTLANSANDTDDAIKNVTFDTPNSRRIMTRLRLSSVDGLQSRCSGRLRQGCRGPVCAVCARNLVSASRSNLSDSPSAWRSSVFFLHASDTVIVVRQKYSFDGHPGAEARQPRGLENHSARLARRRCLRELRNYEAIMQ